MQAELALRCREDIKNCAVQRRVVYNDMAEQSRRGTWKHVSWHVYILAGAAKPRSLPTADYHEKDNFNVADLK